MCSKNHTSRSRKSKAACKPARKSRTKTRKPKYLSLKLQLSPNHQTKTHKTQQKPPINKIMPQQQQPQQLINLFPLHPENLVQDHTQEHHDDQVSDHVALLLETTTDDTTTSLHDILDSTTTTSEEGSQAAALSPSLTYVYRGHESDHHQHHNNNNRHHHQEQKEDLSLVKTAMKRCKERDASEERWVSYWEVVEKKEQEEVSSTTTPPTTITTTTTTIHSTDWCYAAADALEKMVMMQAQVVDDHDHTKMIGLVGLKLDYQQILNAWSDKGPLYIKGESPQTVPDLLDASNGIRVGGGSIWRVPEMGSSSSSIGREKEEWKMGQREASVLRYKEKRQSRLFSKRIRYQVRKLNAEKRPRLKGRFVKRHGEE